MFDVIFSHQKQPFTNILYSGNVQKLTWVHWLFFLVNIRPVFCNLTKVGCHHRYCPTKFAISFEMLLYILLSVSMKNTKKRWKKEITIITYYVFQSVLHGLFPHNLWQICHTKWEKYFSADFPLQVNNRKKNSFKVFCEKTFFKI